MAIEATTTFAQEFFLKRQHPLLSAIENTLIRSQYFNPFNSDKMEERAY